VFGFNSHQDVGVVENQKFMIELQKFEALEEIIIALEDMQKRGNEYGREGRKSY